MNLRSAAGVAGLLLAVTIIGCTEDGYKISEPSNVFEVSPLFVGSAETDAGFPEVPFTASLDGAPATVTWASSDTTVARVSAAGVATPVAPGFAAITATMGSRVKSASLTVSAIPGILIQNGVAVTGIGGEQGDGLLYRIVVPPGTTSLNVTLSGGTGDIDVYVLPGVPASPDDYECVSWNGGNGEECIIADPVAGRWYIYLDVYAAAAGATLLVTRTP
jgi:xanthomonalisin